jgi:hypothetical protein
MIARDRETMHYSLKATTSLHAGNLFNCRLTFVPRPPGVLISKAHPIGGCSLIPSTLIAIKKT